MSHGLAAVILQASVRKASLHCGIETYTHSLSLWLGLLPSYHLGSESRSRGKLEYRQNRPRVLFSLHLDVITSEDSNSWDALNQFGLESSGDFLTHMSGTLARMT